ncbi:RNA polymerase II transcription initiation/nucleotide excision repair factor TFIIH, subunit TFB4 [Phaffia rhodozyma]|uniref:General transcription and DNA repair factor IIH subunit TFB4 n=1 Tax=Phaffia rhodozyma TaxID=264483 RepID=A0A0F7STR4_PHARH|nr:RNA polymerase II transcription initiation/nucleotide excision repair factor TFIIH, subunit TFB4 [Phaffia rhodozyma]
MIPIHPTPSLHTPGLLCLVLDLTPLSWHDASQPSSSSGPSIPDQAEESFELESMLSHVMVFLNAFLAEKAGNGLAIWGVKGRRSYLLYATTDPISSAHRPDPNTFEPFKIMADSVISKVRQIMTDESNPTEGMETTSLVTALTKALCYINRLHTLSASSTPIIIPPPPRPSSPSANAQSTAAPPPSAAVLKANSLAAENASYNSRILVVSASEEESSGYVSLMNCIFSAQKARIMIDVCKVTGSDAIFLQQAAHLTGGIYLRTPKRTALLQYLMMTFLPSRPLRQHLLLPSQERVDFRAACFCHKTIVDVGYVCSVCLSIFCKPIPVCSTCKTKFPLKTLQALGFSMPRPPPATSAAGGAGNRLAALQAGR